MAGIVVSTTIGTGGARDSVRQQKQRAVAQRRPSKAGSLKILFEPNWKLARRIASLMDNNITLLAKRSIIIEPSL